MLNDWEQCPSCEAYNPKGETCRCTVGVMDAPTIKPKRKRKKKVKASPKDNTHLESKFLDMMMMLAPPDFPMPMREYHFKPTGKRNPYRFDFAFPSIKVAIEIEGGIYGYGRHNRPTGYTNDCIKYNHATLAGWRVLRLTSPMLEAKHIEPIIQLVIEELNHE